MDLRQNVLIRPAALGAKDLEHLARYVARARKTQSAVSNFEDDAPADQVEWVINKQVRDTQEVHLTAAITRKLNGILDAGITALVNPFYEVEVLDYEPVHILRYGAGGHYIPHVDAETLYTDDEGIELWEKTLDRDLSVVYFLNDNFHGGELFFPQLDLSIKPRAGTLVCFPSDHNYIHGVQPVTAGERYSLVTWMRVKGMPGVEEINEQSMLEYQRCRPRQLLQPPRVRKGGTGCV